MLSTLPYESPIDTDEYNDIVLFADGTLVSGARNHRPVVHALKDACAADSICDILFFDENLEFRNQIPSGTEIPFDQFIVSVTPNKCCKMDSYENVTLEFGNGFPDSVTLINAVHADVNYLRQIFVVDTGDSTVKVFDHNGNSIAVWTDIGDPYRVKISAGNVLLLDRSDNTVKRYDFDGNYVDTAVDYAGFDNIIAFLPAEANKFWIADMNGERITFLFNGSPAFEVNSDFCFWGVTFYISRVVALDGRLVLRAVDRDGNFIITYGTYCCI